MGIIYKATNKVNGRAYIGLTIVGLEDRKRRHIYDAFKGDSSSYFHKALRKYGEDNFVWEILEENDNREELFLLEYIFIAEHYDSGGFLYNLTLGGEGTVGYNHSDETKKKISEANKGKKRSEETRKKISEALKGKKLPEETKKKMSEARKGEKNPNYGKKFSEEHCKNMSEGHWNSSFPGVNYVNRNRDPWRRVWQLQIQYNGKRRSLGVYEDPYTASLVYFLVWEEIY